ncbi:hypothetical protein, variant 4 [Aphanomyces invadans]|uniref:PX domain-containing protein n=2 Tax=Aphanomyces invadans TaxID=157072 RepID=A0A024TXZ4_9STRA|nr:hypothetical protein, variant 3 [Aphanomyces invadans]XP_008872459.1 hypothetical protein, variant 4 [Aphanomyces invadans]ETV99030.1 hypothetical protein, variant 3 [Aphanomyces invadans]ETV99031.1 hypothetical protein, variant 4 [Aphanomyces invadans]|eukprot:XP_008872458.1 hypothetical protein, variant 3 [Aphanomyces invadans]
MDHPSSRYSFVAAIDVMFAIVATHWLWCIRPLPKTYLSEIIFPVQLCLRALASLWLALVTVITALYSISWGWPPELPSGTFLAADSLAWGMSTALIWMEHRRSLRTSPYLRAFWILRWSLLTKYLWGVLTNDDPAAVGWTSPMVLLYACLFVTHSILASAGVWPTRQLTTSSPEVLAMARARIKSFNGKSFMNRPLHPSSWVAHRGQGPVPGSYGSFGQSSTAPHDGTPSPLPGLAHTPVVVRVPKVKICIPSWTLSRRSEISYVSYKVLILSEGETWSVRRRYSDFAHLRSELPHWIRSGAAFPDKSLFKRFDPKRIDTRRAQLEAFLNVSPTWMLFTPNETVVHAACRGPSRL